MAPLFENVENYTGLIAAELSSYTKRRIAEAAAEASWGNVEPYA
jgi:hypothetical protein